MNRNRLISMVATVAAMFFASIGQASAISYQVDFTSQLDPLYSVSAVLNVNGTNDVTSLSGSVGGDGAITGLNPGEAPWIIDNKFFALANPVVSNGGILFNTASWVYNLYSVGTAYYLSTYNPDGVWYNPGLTGELTFSVVPLPPALLLFGSALFGMGLLRRKGRKTAVPQTAIA